MDLPKIEEEILDFWDRENIFKRSIENRKDSPVFTFYDGPPFASGSPHYGHVLASSIKDTVLRYKTMRGYKVPRRLGWDCHGLPVENLIEKELGIRTKSEIEEMGVLKFNEACRNNVFNCVDEWKETLRRVGRWADYENDYATMENDYIESVWWVLKTLWDEGLVYRDYRVTPYCYRCGTPVSNFEVNQGYDETEDPSLFVRFRITTGRFKEAHLLAWTTTPWTLIGNCALAVHPDMTYVLVRDGGEQLILLKERMSVLDDPETIEEFRGEELEGVEYEPVFGDLSEEEPEGIENAFRVYLADFVGTEEGTGVVHTAVMYGEEDFALGREHGLPFFHVVDEKGRFSVGKWQGSNVKEVEENIINDLDERGLLKKREDILHSYPFCWRCDTPLLYYALRTWYIEVTAIKEEMLGNNEKIYWRPEHIKKGRFGKWLEGARDWAFSRNRFWGAPIPIWECEECEAVKCVGGKEELREVPEDLHRPFIDEITFECKECGGQMKRVEEVFDCWFESGSMPYAQWHYPFENKDYVEENFPADFIAEGVDQTRGWFYTLHVLATALTRKNVGLGENDPAFKNAIVNGFIFDEKGKKLSKKLKNYPDMGHIFSQYGADSLRFFLLSSTPVGEDYRFSEKRVKEVHSGIMSTLYNSFTFFETYKKEVKEVDPSHPLNKWMISRVQKSNKRIVERMESYDLTKASREVDSLVDDLSNWYIRRSREAIKEGEEEFLFVLRSSLVSISKMMAPFAPFLSDHIYQRITGGASVHLEDFPVFNEDLIDEELLRDMERIKEISSKGLKERADAGIKVRQPLSALKIPSSQFSDLKEKEDLLKLAKEEVNVKEVVFDGEKEEVELDKEITPELKEEGMIREITRLIQNLRKKGGLVLEDEVELFYEGEDFKELFSKWEDHFKKEATAGSIREGKPETPLSSKEGVMLDGKELSLYIRISR